MYYIHISIHTHIHTYIYKCIYNYTYVYVCVCARARARVCVCVHVCVSMLVFIYLYDPARCKCRLKLNVHTHNIYAGRYTFSTESNDGSHLWVAESMVVNNGGLHGVRREQGVVALNAGLHTIKADFFVSSGAPAMIVRISGVDTQDALGVARDILLEGMCSVLQCVAVCCSVLQ